MFVRIFVTALIAGAVAGVFVWGAQMVRVVPLIHQAEVYEEAMTQSAARSGPTAERDSKESAEREADSWAPADGFERGAFTLLSTLLTAIGFALILTGAIALRGRDVDWRKGIFWGLAGFAVFYGAPSLGLAPEIPGMQAADLPLRQVWWVGTVAATAMGLGVIFFVRPVALKAVGGVLIALPHVIGAPYVEPHASALPAELAAQFVVASLLTSCVFWMVLGGLSGYVYRRLGEPELRTAETI